MGDSPLLLGVDVGSSGIKALLLDRQGREAAAASVASPFTQGTDGTEMTVDALRSALARVLEGLGPARHRVVAVGVAGVAESGAPLDDHDRPLAPIIAWHDPRGEETVARLGARFGTELAHLIGQRLRPVSSVAKLGWLLDHGVGPVRRWLGVPELCLFHLTGEQVTEHSLAARTGCYDIARHRYLPEVAAAVGLSVDVFPSVERAGCGMGRVSRSGSAWSGLPFETLVTLAGHDHLAGADGCGASRDDLINSVGTAETVIGRHGDLPDIEQATEARIAVTVQPGAEGWATLASAARSGMILGRVAAQLGRTPTELDSLAANAGEADVAELLDAVRHGEDVSLDDEPPGAVWNGLLHALARRTADAIDRISALSGSWPRVVVFGGGSRSDPWLRAKAQVAAVPVWRSGVADAASRGAALRAGMAAGWWDSPEQAPPVPLEPVRPGPASSTPCRRVE